MSDHTTSSAQPALHICRSCASPLVHIVDGNETAPGQWDLTLRCPECDDVREVSCARPDLARLEHELCQGVAAIQKELERVTRASFEEDIERFVHALERDAILPVDFGIPR
jgi:hypothetical protein